MHDGEVSYNGSVYNIERFDLGFTPVRKEVPIYLGAVFPKMLQVCGEIAQGAILTWCTVEHARTAAVNVALGARQAGRDAQEVDVATLLGCTISDDKEEARSRMRGPIASYVGLFPRYRRLMAEAGFADQLEEVRKAWQAGDQARSMRLVPTDLIDRVSLAGTPQECKQRIALYREAGIGLPLIAPRVAGPNAKKEAMEVIRACAPS